jgi:alkylation response protein AidB-like acyl-CoA dehydrogenase
MIQKQGGTAPLLDDRVAGTEPDQELIARAAGLVPLLRKNAEKGSEQRFVPEPVMRAIEEAGLFSLLVPRRLGGQAANMRTTMEVLAELGRGDGSTAWAATVLNICGWFASTFGEQAQNDVIADGEAARVCGVLMPGERCERVDGGLPDQWAVAVRIRIIRRAMGHPGDSGRFAARGEPTRVGSCPRFSLDH